MQSEQYNGQTVFILEQAKRSSMGSFCVTRPWQLTEAAGIAWLNETGHTQEVSLTPAQQSAIRNGTARAVNNCWGCTAKMPSVPFSSGKKRMHLLALGDVGATLLTGLVLLGGDVIERIGIYDVNQAQMQRYAFEMNQIAWPRAYDALPAVHPLQAEELFSCDVFIFCACKAVPPLSTQKTDVRMAQLAGNAAIIKHYAKLARAARYQGLFCVVSDPVDVLSRAAFLYSNQNKAGEWDGNGLRPEQIQGFGLGVMNARAAYYAKKEPRFQSFLSEGRAYGPHGQALVIANSLSAYDDVLSRELTQQVVQANLALRETGFKPYIAPALSSGALSILAAIRGDWHYSAIPLGNAYFGCYNRFTQAGLDWEVEPIPEPLMARLKNAYDTLVQQESLL
ncbi:MAG: lactate dehydrogenase [Eubacteriales bacterium]|nr:lactate dehydrogenase [Eubacteriales bacterium]